MERRQGGQSMAKGRVYTSKGNGTRERNRALNYGEEDFKGETMGAMSLSTSAMQARRPRMWLCSSFSLFLGGFICSSMIAVVWAGIAHKKYNYFNRNRTPVLRDVSA